MSSTLSCRATRARQEQCRDRKAVAQSLGSSEDVGRDAVVVGREGRTRAAHTALYFVENQHRPHFVTAAAQRLEHRPPEVVGAADALDRLDDDGGRFAIEAAQQCAGIVARREAYLEGRARKAVPLFQGTPCHRARRGGSAVKAVLEGDCFCATGDLEGKLEGILVRFGAAVEPEHGVEAQARELRQPRRCALANGHRQRVGLKGHLPCLALERRQPTRVPIAQSRHRMTAVKVQELAPIARVQPNALAVHHLDGVLRKHLRQMAFDRPRHRFGAHHGACPRSSRVPGR